ncbi:sensor histidine kinase [Leptolyngbya ohadii]|uniref:sensor histidine kinase n=1 Tax=Leptolyngbya ohadii TaxID=1962290 RepID=UPI000B59CBA7|nr:MASE1 domain-containing protein [Leptolyngbya ohadii]
MPQQGQPCSSVRLPADTVTVTEITASSSNFFRHFLRHWLKWNFWLVVGSIALLYAWTAQLCLSLLNLNADASPLWIPTGIALAALLWFGGQMWVGVALGVLLLNHSLSVPWLLSLGSVTGSTLEALTGAYLLRTSRVGLTFDRSRDVLNFVAQGVLVPPVVNATIGTLTAYRLGYLGWNQVSHNWWTIWLGDGMGILVFTPLLLTAAHCLTATPLTAAPLTATPPPLTANAFTAIPLQNHVPIQRFSKRLVRHWLDRLREGFAGELLLEQLIWAGLLVVISIFVFCSRPTAAIAQYPLEYAPFPLIVWAALRFSQTHTMIASLLLSAIALGGTTSGDGPFVAKAQDPRQVVLLLQAFIGVVTITALILAAAMAERRQAEAQLQLTAERNRLIGEIALRIRRSLELDQILDTTVQEVRQFLEADRVFICRFDADGGGRVVAESVTEGWTSAEQWTIAPSIYPELQTIFEQCPISVVDDTRSINASTFVQSYHDRYQVKAGIAVPLFVESQSGICPQVSLPRIPAGEVTAERQPCLFGILIVNQCSFPRHWEQTEIELLEQLGTQVTIAIQQAQLYEQVQSLNATLEHQVTERTLQLQDNMAELEQLNQLRDVLIHAVAHDLRTTVMGTLMVLQSLQKQPGEAISVGRSLLERMIQSGEVQLSKLNTLLEVYQNQTQEVVLHWEKVSLAELVRSVMEECEPMLLQNQITLLEDLPTNLPAVQIDRDKVRRVLHQLVTNAVKHNPPGIEVMIQAGIESGQLLCTVTDNGKGIPADQCDRLFDLCLGRCDERKLNGLSLGLPFCQQIIKAHRGRMGVTSFPGTGSQFWFTLPIH